MSGSHARLCGLALGTLLATLAPAFGQDFFEQKKREMAVQAQQTIADVKGALETSRKLELTDATAAKALLLKRLLEVNDSASLDDKQRADLQRSLRTRLAEVDATAREQQATADFKSKQETDKQLLEQREKAAQAKLNDAGKSLFDQAKGRTEFGNKSLDALGNVKKDAEKNRTAANIAFEKSVANNTEQRFTPYFKERAETRNQTKLSKGEAALLKTLNSTLSVDFKSQSLKEVLDELDARTGGLNIFLDPASLKDLEIDYNTKVNFKAKGVTVRTVLKKIFADLGLTYVIKDAGIQVITPERTKDFLVTRAYPIADLVMPVNTTKFNAFAQGAIAAQQAQQLMQMIVQSIDPGSWQGVGDRGYGTITYNEATKTIIIRHTAEMHYQLGGGLGR